MSTRFLNKYAGATATDAPSNRSKGAGIGYDTTTGKMNYNDGGVIRDVLNRSNAPIVVTAATLALTQAAHDGFAVVLSRALGVTVTLPAATGSGARFLIYSGLALSGGSHVLQVANAQDFMRGAQFTGTDNGSGAGLTWPTSNSGTVSTESDTLTWNGTTKGGIVADVIEIVDVAANTWAIETYTNETGTEATPFSAAV